MPGLFLRPDELFPYRTLREVLASRPQVVISVAPGDLVVRALQLMSDHNIGLVVVLEGERLVGVLSERDLARYAGRSPEGAIRELRVEQLMTRDVSTVGPGELIGRCMAVMDERGARHLPVVDNGRVIAVLSLRDLLREAVAHQRRLLSDIERERLAAYQSLY